MGESRNVTMTPDRWLLLRDKHFSVTIQLVSREQEDGSYKYSVMSNHSTFLNMKAKGFCYDMKDDESFLKETRFDTIDLAFEEFKKYVDYCCNLEMSSSMYEIAVQYKFNDCKVKAHPNIIKRMKECGILVKE